MTARTIGFVSYSADPSRKDRRAAWATVVMMMGTLAASLVIAWPENLHTLIQPWIVAYFAFGSTGVLIIIRRPDHPIGWLFTALGLVTGIVLLQTALAPVWLAAGNRLVVAWSDVVANSLATAAILAVPAALLVFPQGVSERIWRPLLWLTGLAAFVGASAALLSGGWGGDVEQAIVPSPLRALTMPWGDVLSKVFIPLLAIVMLGSGLRIVVRFRRSRGVERHQIKWLALAVSLLAAALAVTGFDTKATWEAILAATALSCIPASVTLAILRYRLYDIDLVIKRTLVYGSLTALLGATYVGLVVGLSDLLRLGSNNDLVVAGSTLAVAALFSPARRSIQAFVDRRFYRRRFDAQRTMDAFSTRLRDKVDLPSLTQDLAVRAQDTLQPASVSLWLAGSAGDLPTTPPAEER